MTLDSDRALALSYVPARHREAVRALWTLDATLGAVALAGGEPMIARIKLAWWREALERLDAGPPPAEPLLAALAGHVLPCGVTGVSLSAIEQGWAHVLDGDVPRGAEIRGARLFAMTARLLGSEPSLEHEEAGVGWALVDQARGAAADPGPLLDLARHRLGAAEWPPRLRALGVLAAVARRDVERGMPFELRGAPARMLRMLRHRLTGR